MTAWVSSYMASVNTAAKNLTAKFLAGDGTSVLEARSYHAALPLEYSLKGVGEFVTEVITFRPRRVVISN